MNKKINKNINVIYRFGFIKSKEKDDSNLVIARRGFQSKNRLMLFVTISLIVIFSLLFSSCYKNPDITGQISSATETSNSNTNSLNSETSSNSLSSTSTAANSLLSDISSTVRSNSTSSTNISKNTSTSNSSSSSTSSTPGEVTPTPDVSQYKEPYFYVKTNVPRSFLNFRSQPNTQSIIIRELKPGMRLKYLASYDKWIKVLSPYEEVGYVYAEYVTDVSPALLSGIQESDLFTKWESSALTKGFYSADISKYIGRTLSQSYKPLKGITVILDPGHGGADFGAEHKISRLTTIIKEKNINLSVSINLEKELRELGATVFMTRKDDSGTGLYYRSAFINSIVLDRHKDTLEKKIELLIDLEKTRLLTDTEKSEKAKLTADLNDCIRLASLMQHVMDSNSDYQSVNGIISFKTTGLFEGLGSNADLRKIMDISREYEDIVAVSVHCNNIANTATKNGMEIYYGTNNAVYKDELNLFLLDPNKNIINPSYQFYNDTSRLYFAQSVRDRILTETNLQLATINSGQVSDGLRETATCITRETNLTGIQIELGYLSNNDDRTFLTEPTGQKRVAHGIALGIYDYFCKRLS